MTTDTRIAFIGGGNLAAAILVLKQAGLRKILLKALHAGRGRGAELSQEFVGERP
ncbi:MAG: hypothetical protein ACRER0_00925 [Gammaproteobacteria bacterium]